jgi:hypothetical protein
MIYSLLEFCYALHRFQFMKLVAFIIVLFLLLVYPSIPVISCEAKLHPHNHLTFIVPYVIFDIYITK